MNPVCVETGNSPIVLAQPHSGTWLPHDVIEALEPAARELFDTDWRIPELYEGLLPDATIVRATFNRYVIDANRPPDDASLYPGQNTTSLVPLTDFDAKPIWRQEPDAAEITRRKSQFHAPYHTALAEQLARVKAQHGFAVLYDCHSIRSHVPYLFEGELPVLNIGTNSGTSCSPAIESAVEQACATSAFTHVLNGRFKGGWTTRHYGRPAENIHAVQMEIAQSAYLAAEEPPFTYSPDKAATLRDTLAAVFAGIESTFGDL
ncbi:N-formylglutamate deformylase [Qipengyuania gelatinilytica]|uniref:N-formylglutamate deformylase n=1 Tax=Qipengyuania gelatinilytica TaxID=2867231 RepID=A0ABX9A5P2_9SPHN|nr:N-formylglutamate deformylase [Qipengyuania gelatinilytica]QZD96361.1 N-formylglutamate deformylase [Qipengyuania gelatinilytica]